MCDYYHIGVVDDDPRYVLNAKGKDYGFCRDALAAKNGWDYVAYLKYVDYGSEEKEGDKQVEQATVVLPSGSSGSTVNLRQSNSQSAALVDRVPVGSVVTVLEDQGQWCRIQWNGKTGYMMSNYLEYDGQDGEAENLTQEQVGQINAALKQIEVAVDQIGSIVGRG